jgi:anti-anti-sigma factor
MALLPGTLSKAGPLCSTIVDFDVVEYGPDTRVVTVGGEIDALTALELATFVAAQLAAAPLVVLDLDRVQFMGSAGLSALLKVNELAIGENRQLRLVCHSRMVNRAIEVTGLRERFSFAGTVSEALNSQ